MVSNVYVLVNSENFRPLFFNIKKKTDELLSEFNDVDFLENPSVDIESIVKKCGLTIKYVPKEKIPGRHGTLNNGVIKLNKDDTPEEQRFTAGHELEHYIKQKTDENLLIFPRVEIKNILDKQDVKHVKSVFKEAEAARSNYEQVIILLKECDFFNKIAKTIAENASQIFGKPISTEKALNSIAKLICTKNTKFDDKFIFKATDDLYNEEIADYFAANLLVPIERFMLWEDRSDEEIANAFKVPIECIVKRKEEVKLEFEFLSG
jgi:uncharacterized protein YfeS